MMEFWTSNEDYNEGARDIHLICLEVAGIEHNDPRIVSEDLHYELIDHILKGNKVEIDVENTVKVHKKYVKGGEAYVYALKRDIERMRKLKARREKHLVDGITIKATFE